MKYLIQARRPHGAYRTLDTVDGDLVAAVWTMRQFDVAHEPWASSTLRVVGSDGKVYLRATPKRGAK